MSPSLPRTPPHAAPLPERQRHRQPHEASCLQMQTQRAYKDDGAGDQDIVQQSGGSSPTRTVSVRFFMALSAS